MKHRVLGELCQGMWLFQRPEDAEGRIEAGRVGEGPFHVKVEELAPALFHLSGLFPPAIGASSVPDY